MIGCFNIDLSINERSFSWKTNKLLTFESRFDFRVLEKRLLVFLVTMGLFSSLNTCHFICCCLFVYSVLNVLFPVCWITQSSYWTLNLCRWQMSQLNSFRHVHLHCLHYARIFVCLWICPNLSLCIFHLCVHFFSLIISSHTRCDQAQLCTQCLSFLTVGRLIFRFSEICLDNKPLTRQKEGLGHCLDMREQRVLNCGAR